MINKISENQPELIGGIDAREYYDGIGFSCFSTCSNEPLPENAQQLLGFNLKIGQRLQIRINKDSDTLATIQLYIIKT